MSKEFFKFTLNDVQSEVKYTENFEELKNEIKEKCFLSDEQKNSMGFSYDDDGDIMTIGPNDTPYEDFIETFKEKELLLIVKIEDKYEEQNNDDVEFETTDIDRNFKMDEASLNSRLNEDKKRFNEEIKNKYKEATLKQNEKLSNLRDDKLREVEREEKTLKGTQLDDISKLMQEAYKKKANEIQDKYSSQIQSLNSIIKGEDLTNMQNEIEKEAKQQEEKINNIATAFKNIKKGFDLIKVGCDSVAKKT